MTVMQPWRIETTNQSACEMHAIHVYRVTVRKHLDLRSRRIIHIDSNCRHGPRNFAQMGFLGLGRA
jgi:hypothetical protein